jgi:hypothetical protein
LLESDFLLLESLVLVIFLSPHPVSRPAKL